MAVKFTKMHGAGNDFVIIDEWEQEVIPENQEPEFVAQIANRHLGVGSDGVIFIQKSSSEDAKFHFYNPDGSTAEMCGNGIRCLAKYLYDNKLVEKKEMSIETLAGVKNLELTIDDGLVAKVKVNMGAPKVESVNTYVRLADFALNLTSVNMGNPHTILFVNDVENAEVLTVGSTLRNHTEMFPQGVNVHFVERINESEFKIRTYERGVEDETLACGTGICASAVAAVVNKLADPSKKLLFHARGGDIEIELETKGNEISTVYMTGGAKVVYTGDYQM